MARSVCSRAALRGHADKVLGATAAAFAAATGAGLVGTTTEADAQIIYSGPVNLNIPATTNGLYLNVINGQINEPGNTGGSTVPGWDVNPWSGSGFGLFSPGSPAGGVYVNLGADTFNLPEGTEISAAATFATLGSTTNNGQWNLNSSDNLVGFRFLNEGNNEVHFGWFRVAFGSTITQRTMVEYAYEATPGAAINAGAIPEPSAFGLLAIGAAGLMLRRRRTA